MQREMKKKGITKPLVDPKLLEDEDKLNQFSWNLTMTKMDVKRVSKNFAFMARTLSKLSSDAEVLKAGKAVYEHHFDDHVHCKQWCRPKLNMYGRRFQVLQEQDEGQSSIRQVGFDFCKIHNAGSIERGCARP